jgi:hypothetical protein
MKHLQHAYETPETLAKCIRVLKHPLNDNFKGDYPILQYADDTLLILLGDAKNPV